MIYGCGCGCWYFFCGVFVCFGCSIVSVICIGCLFGICIGICIGICVSSVWGNESMYGSGIGS